MSTTHRNNLLRFSFACLLWFAAWSCLIVSLTKNGEPWPWGGVAIYLAVVAMTATLWWMVEVVAHKAVKQLSTEVEVVVRAELDVLKRDNEEFPALLADAVVKALSVEHLRK